MNRKTIINSKDYVNINLRNEYKKVFENILLSRINLKEYDKKISSSKLGFSKVKKNPLLKIHLNEYLDLDYFCIINNFYIEKLNDSQKNILENGTSEEKEKIVLETYKKVIVDDSYKDNRRFKKNYLNTTDLNDFVFNDELVILICYGKNTIKYCSKNNYLNNYIEKKHFLKEISNEIKEEIARELVIPCKVLCKKVIFNDKNKI